MVAISLLSISDKNYCLRLLISDIVIHFFFLPITSISWLNPAATRSKAWVCGRSLDGVCGFESWRAYGRLSLLSAVCCLSPLCQADHSSRGVLPSVLYLIVILKPQQWGDLGPLRLTNHGKKLNLLVGFIWYLKSFSSASCTMVPGSLPGVKASSAVVKEGRNYTSTPILYNHSQLYAELFVFLRTFQYINTGYYLHYNLTTQKVCPI